jgi:hypothetical protein
VSVAIRHKAMREMIFKRSSLKSNWKAYRQRAGSGYPRRLDPESSEHVF